MKSMFPGYFRPSDSELRDMWRNATFIFDANVLLNLYRYSDQTKDELIGVFDKLGERAWLTNHVVKEYLERRRDVISQQESSYGEIEAQLDIVISTFEGPYRHPFLTDKLLKKLKALRQVISVEISDRKELLAKRFDTDEILDKLLTIFESKVGAPYSEEQLQDLIKEGKERYSKHIPPGYKDSGKEDKGDIRQFGDLIIWKQILNKAHGDKTNVIFITDDKKEDWWHQFKGKTIGPRPELIAEFNNVTDQNIYFYSSDSFLKYAKQFLSYDVTEKAIDEIKSVRNDIYRTLKKSTTGTAATTEPETIEKLEEELEKLTIEKMFLNLELLRAMNKDENINALGQDSKLKRRFDLYLVENRIDEIMSKLEILRTTGES